MAKETKKGGIRWRLWLTAAGWCVVFVSTAMAARKVQHYVLTDPQFVLSHEQPGSLAIEGAVYASRARIASLFAGDFGSSIFAVPIEERRRRLLGVDWVLDASISRIWPNRLLVRVRERAPVAFVTLPVRFGRGSRVLLIDRDGVLLDPPPQSRFSFPILSGVSEEQTDPERRIRVHAMQALLADLGPMAKSVSEVNAAAPEDLKVVAQVDGRALELTIGDENFARRFENFMNHYPEIRKRLGNVSTFDLRLDDRITAKE